MKVASRDEKTPAAERLIRFDGVVTEKLVDGRFRVRFPNGREVVAVRVVESDEPEAGQPITVEISQDDTNSGRLFFCRAALADSGIQHP